MSNSLKNLVRPLTGYGLAQKSALYILADLAGPDGTVYVYTEKLAEYMNCSIRTTQRALHKLEEKECLTSLRDKAGRGRANWYRFNVDRLNNVSSVESVPVAVPDTLPPTNGRVVPPKKKPLTVYDPLPPETPERKAEIKAMLAAKKAELLAKKHEEKRERPGRAARSQTKLV